MGRRIEIPIPPRRRAREDAGCVRYLGESAAHLVLPAMPRVRENLPPVGAPGGGCSGCKFGGPSAGTYFLSHSSNTGPRGNRPGTMLQASAFASMIVTFGSPDIGTKSFVASPRTGPAEPK